MANFTVRMTTTTQNFDRIDEIRARLKDFSVPLSNIIADWARGNVRKFNAAEGAETTGAIEPPTAWFPVSAAYYRQKHGPIKRGNRSLFPDWLMVRTGALMRSLTNRGLFAEYFDQSKAIFGTPLDSEDAAKASYNFKKRPTVFLGRSDRLAIKQEFQDYLSLGGNYKALLFAQAGARSQTRKELESLDADIFNLNFGAS